MASTIVRSLHFFSETPKNPKNTKKKRPPPLKISTLRSDVDPAELRDLLASSDLSCHRFPVLDPSGRPEPVDLDRLRLAISHSAVVVSVFCSPPPGDLGFRSARGRLAGFGRAVSDLGLTASIHDVVVDPSMRRLGIGRMIVNRILRILTNRGIYDISALCTERERLFFKACGFGNDVLGSTTMMYTRTPPTNMEHNSDIKQAGQMMLLVPPPREPWCLSRQLPEEDA